MSSSSSSSSSSLGVGPVMHESCSRSRSRIARRLIETEILAVAKLEAKDLPEGCVLNPDRDLFGHHEAHKRPARQGNLKCAFCQKVFKNHYYLDRHMDNKHADLFLLNATTCMADYCDVLPCDKLDDNPKLLPCTDNDMKRRQFRCRALFDRCFPVDAGHQIALGGRPLHDVFMHEFCDQLSCDVLLGQRRSSSKSALGDDTTTDASGRSTLTVLVVAAIAIFYVYMGYSHWVSASRKDLRRGPRRNRKIE